MYSCIVLLKQQNSSRHVAIVVLRIFVFQMLIQVQFIKRELLIATTAIGQLARENELNLRIMATVPAFLLAWGSYRAGRCFTLLSKLALFVSK